jgi:hypothetical protein
MELLMTPILPPNVVIPTGASLSRKEREAEWRNLVFAAKSEDSFS